MKEEKSNIIKRTRGQDLGDLSFTTMPAVAQKKKSEEVGTRVCIQNGMIV